MSTEKRYYNGWTFAKLLIALELNFSKKIPCIRSPTCRILRSVKAQSNTKDRVTVNIPAATHRQLRCVAGAIPGETICSLIVRAWEHYRGIAERRKHEAERG